MASIHSFIAVNGGHVIGVLCRERLRPIVFNQTNPHCSEKLSDSFIYVIVFYL